MATIRDMAIELDFMNEWSPDMLADFEEARASGDWKEYCKKYNLVLPERTYLKPDEFLTGCEMEIIAEEEAEIYLLEKINSSVDLTRTDSSVSRLEEEEE